MVVCANVRLPLSEFPLDGVFEDRPSVRVELERTIPTGRGAAPFLRVDSEDREWVSRAVGRDDAVESAAVVDAVDEGVLLRVVWRTGSVPFLRILAETDAACLDAIGRADGWSFQLRHPSHDAFSSWCQRCAGRDIELAVESVRNTGRPRRDGVGPTLTEPQREALTAALARGYFAVPRQTTLQALSEQLGISDTATSQRIRRGVRRVLAETL